MGIKLDTSSESTPVEIGDRTYTRRPFTRSMEKAQEKYEETVRTLDEWDAIVDACREFLNVTLEPEAGKKKLAGDVLHELWHADKLTSDALTTFMRRIIDADGEGETEDESERRPT